MPSRDCRRRERRRRDEINLGRSRGSFREKETVSFLSILRLPGLIPTGRTAIESPTKHSNACRIHVALYPRNYVFPYATRSTAITLPVDALLRSAATPCFRKVFSIFFSFFQRIEERMEF